VNGADWIDRQAVTDGPWVAYTVPGKPVGQNRNGSNRTRAYGKTPEQRQFASMLAAHGMRARRAAGWETTDAPVEVWIRVVFASERPDTDSPIKAILDSLEVSRPRLNRPGAGFLANDRQVRRYVVDRAVDRDRPRVEVRLAPFGAAARADWAAAWGDK
jgi:Holliday junction resolvase RusA-like endonuclease